MRRWVLIAVLLLTTTTVVHSFHHKHLLSYLLVSQLGAQRKVIVLPLFIPIPIGLIRGLFHGRSMPYRFNSSPTEIYITSSSSNSNCYPFCGSKGHPIEI